MSTCSLQVELDNPDRKVGILTTSDNHELVWRDQFLRDKVLLLVYRAYVHINKGVLRW